MKVTMRLYRVHDADLIYLYKLDGIDFKKELVNAITSYLHGKCNKVVVPKPIDTKVILPKKVQLCIDVKGEEKLWVEKIIKGYRNNALKSLMRTNVEFIEFPFFNEIVFQEKADAIKSLKEKPKVVEKEIPEPVQKIPKVIVKKTEEEIAVNEIETEEYADDELFKAFSNMI